MSVQEFERRRVRRKHKPLSQSEAERRARQSEREHHRDRVLTFRQWCTVNGFSLATGRRIVQRGEGPPVLQLSPRRIGVKESDNAAWQQARAR